jgi:O-acetylserine/cysteine efflux transporter
MQHLDAAVGTVLVQLGVPFSSLLAALFLGDRLGWRRLLGMLVAFGGVLVLFWDPSAQMPPLSFALIVVSAFFWAVSNILIKRMGVVDVFSINGWMSLFAAPLLLALTLTFETDQLNALTHATWRGWSALAFTVCMSMFLAYGIWYWALRRFDVNQVVPTTLLAPVVGIFLAVLMLGEQLTTARVLGALLVISGVGVIVLRRPTYAAKTSGD